MNNEKKSRFTRRQFIHQSGIITSSLALGTLSSKNARAQSKSSNDKLGIGVIGTGGRGNSHLRMLKRLQEEGENIEIIAVL